MNLPETTNKPDHLFKSGNELYKLRSIDGRTKLFKSPEAFAEEAIKYFQWCDKNPWIKKDFIKSGQDAGRIVDLETQRPYTIEGLCNFLGITYQTFSNYEKDEKYKEYFEVLSYIRKVIETNQLEGGMVGAFNSAIIIRKLGLKDNVEHSGEVKQTVTNIEFIQRNIQDAEFTEVKHEIDNF